MSERNFIRQYCIHELNIFWSQLINAVFQETMTCMPLNDWSMEQIIARKILNHNIILFNPFFQCKMTACQSNRHFA